MVGHVWCGLASCSGKLGFHKNVFEVSRICVTRKLLPFWDYMRIKE